MDCLASEERIDSRKCRWIAGVDEVGRGPLAGDVVAAAVILDPATPIPGLNDSKKLSEKQRQELVMLIKEHALALSIGRSSVAEIDSLNILQASLLAMRRQWRLCRCDRSWCTWTVTTSRTGGISRRRSSEGMPRFQQLRRFGAGESNARLRNEGIG